MINDYLGIIFAVDSCKNEKVHKSYHIAKVRTSIYKCCVLYLLNLESYTELIT